MSNDAAKMKMVISWFLYAGTQNILSGNHQDERDRALMVRYRYLEQHVAAVSEQTQAQTNFPKMNDACLCGYALNSCAFAEANLLLMFG